MFGSLTSDWASGREAVALATSRAFEVDVAQPADADCVARMIRDAEASAGTPFQRLGFLTSFYRNAAADCQPVLVKVTRRATGNVDLVLPLLIRESSGLRYIEAADLGMSDYVAPLVGDAFNPTPREMTNIWAEASRKLPPADVLRLKKMPGELQHGKTNPLALLPGTRSMGISTKTLDLQTEHPSEHYKNSGVYKDGMRQLRKLRKLGEVDFRIADTSTEALEQFEHLMAQRRQRFAAMGRPDDLAEPHFQTFYRELIAQAAPRGELLFGGLYLNGECIATDLGLVLGDTHHGIFTTMKDGELRRFSPGTIAFMLILDETSARGIRFYDIGVGDFPYKDRLRGTETPLYENYAALSTRGSIALADAVMRRAVRHGLARFPKLREPVQAMRQRMRRFRLWAAASLAMVEWQSFPALPGLA